MEKHFQVVLVLVLVAGSLPALQGSRRILQAISPALAPSPYWSHAPGSTPSPTPPPTPPPTLPPTPAPTTPPSGGGGGGVEPKDGGGGGGSSGLSGGQKAGILVGVSVGAGLIGFATMVYMKRRRNIQRARFGVLARRSQL